MPRSSILRPRRAAAAFATGLLAAATLVAAPAAPAAAAAEDGACADDSGVTVVVDATALGGDVTVRCATVSGGTGLAALKAAGFEVTGLQTQGESFVCRIDGRPSADETLTVGGKDYQEPCVDYPPAGAYWAYSQAEDSGSWAYSKAGPKDQKVVPGGFEGWTYALNAKQDDVVQPSVAPVRADLQAASGDTQDGADAAADSDEDDGSQVAVWVAVGVVLLLGALAVFTARRRARSRNDS